MSAVMIVLAAADAAASRSLLDHAQSVANESVAKVSGQCVCIFDFDLTLRVQNSTGHDVGSEDSPGIVRHCKDLGYEVALASANCNTEKMKYVLPTIDDDIFTDHWFETPLFQNCDWYKIKELNKITDYLDTPPACAMFFDDLEFNVKEYGRRAGVNWRHVNPETGVTWTDFGSLHPELLKRCDCQTDDGDDDGSQSSG